MRPKALVFAACACALLAGCAAQRPSGVPEFYNGNLAAARRIYQENLAAEPSSRALYLVRLATLELDSGDIQAARGDFIDAVRIMQDFKASGEFKAVIGEEAAKEYKGDPYEQMMALWYLGLTDYMLGEYNKALPSFKSAALADGGTTDERYRSDAASVFIMMAKTYHAMGDQPKAQDEYNEALGVYTFRETVERVADALAQAYGTVTAQEDEHWAADSAYDFLTEGISAGATEDQDPVAALYAAREFAFDRLEKASKSRQQREHLLKQDPNVIAGYIKQIASVAQQTLQGQGSPLAESPLAPVVENVSDPANDLFVVVGLGRGPFKYRSGEYGELGKIGRSDYASKYADVYVDGRFIGRAETVEDVYYQASTRGGRAMDGVLAGKAVFKGVTETGAAIAFAVAAEADSKETRRNALIAGAALLAASLVTRPEADVRSWETLPDKIQMFAAKVPPGTHTVEVRFGGDGVTRFENLQFTGQDETVVYARSGGGGAWSVAPPRQARGLERKGPATGSGP